MAPFVIHVPHAGTLIPTQVRDQFLLDDGALAAEAETSADLWTDLLAQGAWPDAVHVIAPVARIVVDVERYADDTVEPMAGIGRGMIYSHTHDSRRMRRDLRPGERSSLKSYHYDPHWSRLREAAVGSVLIDLHSYPVEPWPVELDPEADRPEIVLGTDENLTPPAWRDALVDHFARAGYSVGLNRPYGGVIDAGADSAAMLEIRRDMLGAGAGSNSWARLVDVLASAPLP